jgi:predicted HNH restriction endonuclease
MGNALEEKDLIPVCPNFHAMLHTSSPPVSVEELKKKINHGMNVVFFKALVTNNKQA